MVSHVFYILKTCVSSSRFLSLLRFLLPKNMFGFGFNFVFNQGEFKDPETMNLTTI